MNDIMHIQQVNLLEVLHRKVWLMKRRKMAVR